MLVVLGVSYAAAMRGPMIIRFHSSRAGMNDLFPDFARRPANQCSSAG
jgi:hypothetical protein